MNGCGIPCEYPPAKVNVIDKHGILCTALRNISLGWQSCKHLLWIFRQGWPRMPAAVRFPTQLPPSGLILQVMIISADAEWQRISLSTKKLEKSPGDMVRDKQLVFDSAEEMAKLFKERLEGITRGASVRSVDGLLDTVDE